MECKIEWYDNQVRREVDSKEAGAAKHAQQQEQLQAGRDALQKHLAATEAEFRIALQVSPFSDLQLYEASHNKTTCCVTGKLLVYLLI